MNPSSNQNNPLQLTLTGALLANLLVLVFPAAAWLLEGRNYELYYSLVQEDGSLEWMTVWAFLMASGGFAIIGQRQHQRGAGYPWLTALLSLGCFLIAMEEISWGQRLLGYRPPEYFLKENFQQEFNLHNIFDTDIRKLVLKGIILGYGVVLPLIALIRPLRPLLGRWGPQVSPLALMPAFVATFWIYETYPWKFSGEVIELMLGLGFAFAAVAPLALRPAGRPGLAPLTLTFAGIAGLGMASFAYSHFSAANDPARIASAQTELEALASDLTTAGRPLSNCSVHKRVYSWAEKYDHLEQLARGQFASLEAQGMPEARAGYFIDPWNSPIWIRHKCVNREDREVAFVYSFGPNRRRDSSDWELGGDDIGVFLVQRGAAR